VADTKNWASIIPLDYSTPDQTRLEFSIGFLSTDWESLQELLSTPESFLADRQDLWPQENELPERIGQRVKWKLLTPIMMHVAPARGSLPAVIKSARSLGLSVSEAQNEAKQAVSADQVIAKMAEILSKKVSDLAPEGAYLAEFAPYTYHLKIHYWPPNWCSAATAASAADPTGTPPDGRNNDPYTKATLGLIGETDVAGTLHFDIGMGNEVRAKFIMDHIENCARTCQKLNTEFEELFLVNTEFVPEGETITVRELGSQTHKPINILQTPSAAPTAAIDSRAPSVRLAQDATSTPEVTFPTIIVDGVSNSDGCYICTLMDVTDTPSAYVCGDIDMKIYCDNALGSGCS
jgi:hypothetical protein